jgi:hypothetical protein
MKVELIIYYIKLAKFIDRDGKDITIRWINTIHSDTTGVQHFVFYDDGVIE